MLKHVNKIIRRQNINSINTGGNSYLIDNQQSCPFFRSRTDNPPVVIRYIILLVLVNFSTQVPSQVTGCEFDSYATMVLVFLKRKGQHIQV